MSQQTGSDQQIRERAYAMWEREGRPAGRHLEHWAAAEREIKAEGAFAQVKARARSAKSQIEGPAAITRKAGSAASKAPKTPSARKSAKRAAPRSQG